MCVINHYVRAVVYDSLTGLADCELLNTMLNDKREQRDAFLQYAANPYLAIRQSIMKNFGFELVIITGEPGSGKSRGIRNLVLDEKNERRYREIKNGFFPNGVEAYDDVLYFNTDDKKLTFPESEYFYFDKSKDLKELNHYPSVSFDEMINKTAKTCFSGSIKPADGMLIADPYGRKIDGVPLFHLNTFDPNCKFILTCHLETIPIFEKIDNEQKIVGYNKQIKVFGNMFNKLTFNALSNYVYEAVKIGGKYNLVVNREPNTITRTAEGCLKKLPNDYYLLLDDINKPKVEVDDFI